MADFYSLPVVTLDPPSSAAPATYEQIEDELKAFEAAERERLGLRTEPLQHWQDLNPKQFTRAQRDTTTILIGGLTVAQDQLIQAGWNALGYHIEVLACPDTSALHFGKEYGNRGQCNPTYFTVGNLIKHLIHLRDVQKIPVPEIIERYLFLTAGACGPCRFGTYTTEYRKALRDAGFDGFRVLLFQQTGLKQATGAGLGLELNLKFFLPMVKAMLAGDVLNAMGYRIRPYEVHPGDADRALEQSKQILLEAFSHKRSIVRALRRCRKVLAAVPVNRLQPKPKVMIIGEFWAMTTEGDGNYHLQRFLESEGAEVDIQIMSAWLLYMIWQGRHDTLKRMELRGEDGGRKGLAGKDGTKRLWMLWAGEKILRGLFGTFAWAIGLENYHLPDMDQIASLAGEHYDLELRGGEGHMEVGKLMQAVLQKKAHMVLSVKPFGCMPSSGVSDGVQSTVLNKFPDAIYCPVETTGDGAVNFQSRVLMYLFKARRKAKEEFESVLSGSRLTPDQATARSKRYQAQATRYPPHEFAGTAANVIHAVAR